MKIIVDRLDLELKKITDIICLSAGWALLTLAIVITVNSLLRKWFNISLQGVDEYGGYCLAICASVGFSQAAYERAHIKISVITDLFPVYLRAFADMVSLLILAIIASILAAKALDVTSTSLSMRALANSSLRTPLSIPQAIWTGALVWFCIVLIVQFLRASYYFLKGHYSFVTDNYGVPSTEEEIAQELEASGVAKETQGPRGL